MRILMRVLAALWLMGMGGTALAAEKLTVMLDWFPNVDHLPIYVAQAQKRFEAAGLEVQILSPSETSDALKLAVVGQVDVAVAYEPQTIVAAAEGLAVRVVGRLVAHPLSTLLYLRESGIRSPADLAGKRIGYTVPGMMDVLLQAFAKINGIPDYEAVNVGFTIIPALTSRQVDAIIGPYKNYEVVELEMMGRAPGYFALEDWGIPDYDELIFVCGQGTLEARGDAVRRFRDCVAEGIEFARANPQAALETYLKAVPEASRDLEAKAFERTLPLYAPGQAVDAARWQRFADFAKEYGLIQKPLDVRSILAPEGL